MGRSSRLEATETLKRWDPHLSPLPEGEEETIETRLDAGLGGRSSRDAMTIRALKAKS
jgi:hypothetical protein